GSGMMVQMASANTVVQTVVSDDKRGRIMSLHVLAFMGTAPLGSLYAGQVAQWLGVPLTLQLSGMLAIVAAVAYQLRLPGVARRLPVEARETALLAEALNAPHPGEPPLSPAEPVTEGLLLNEQEAEAALMAEEVEVPRAQL
ncbi:MAG: MFS transporter, partial [Armatimonadetes bacterium]|nr:MFS transporter [Armatimonadota bacterium]